MSKEPYEIDGLTPVEEDSFEAAEETTETSVATNGKKKKNKKPWSKKKKIIVSVVSAVIAAILIAVIVFVCVMFTGKSSPVSFDQTNYVIDMGNQYYVGTEGSYDESLAKGKEVTTVDGAYNVSTYADFFAQLKQGHDVVVHSKDLKMSSELGTIKLTSDIYGNGVTIDAYDVVKGSVKDYGSAAFLVEAGSEVMIRDMKVFGKAMDPNDNLKTFTAYGSILEVHGNTKEKAFADVFHCIFENSHKIVHLISAYVNMEGCLVRNAADTAISIGTFANQATTFNSKDNIVADSLTGGILTYSYDGGVDANTDSVDTWNTINIEGFLDIYNWKKATELAFVPDTELNGMTGLITKINKFLSEEVVKEEYKSKRVDTDDGPYIHFGILKIATNTYGKNKSKIFYDGKEITVKTVKTDNSIGYGMESFPIPSFGKVVMKELYVTGYFSNNEDTVKVGDKVSNRAAFYKETIGIVEK